MKKLVCFFTATSFVLVLSAQNNMYVVYSMKGTVSVIDNKTETKAKIGTIINEDATLKLSSGSFATLICNESRMFTINKTGNHVMSKFKDSCKTSNSSVSANYVKYIWNELTKSKGSPEKNRKAYMSNVGAVSRGVNNIWVDPRLDTVYYVSGTIPLSWKSYADAEKFEFKLFDKEDAEKEIYSKKTEKKHVDISNLLDKIEPGKSYWWTAMIEGENNEERKHLRYWTKEEYNEYYNKISKLETGASETEAEKNFRLAFILEEAHFLAEAYQHYLKATQLAADNGLYRFVFMSFKKDYEIK
jgi:hypothetical protein